MKILDVRKSGQAQAGSKCAQGKKDGAGERSLAQVEDGEAVAHNLSMYAGGVMEPGGAYRVTELEAMYSEAGFKNVTEHPIPESPHTVVLGTA